MIQGNQVRDVGILEHLGESGMGCGNTGTNCTENGAGIRLKHDSGSPQNTSRNVQVLENRLDRIGMQGIGGYGAFLTIRNNVVDRPCHTKADCGAIGTFGRNDLTSTFVHDVTIDGNVVRNTFGNTDGCAPQFESRFGLAIYIDNYSRDVAVSNNTVVGSTWLGLLYQRSTGTATNNTFYHNVRNDWGGEVHLIGNEARATLNGNVFFSLGQRRYTMHNDGLFNLLGSDANYFFNPYEPANIVSDDAGGPPMTLSDWQTFSGMDGSSTGQWYTQNPGEAPRSRILVNDTDAPVTFALAGNNPRDLDQNPLGSSVMVPAYSSRIVIVDLASPTDSWDVAAGMGHGPSNANRVRIYDGTGAATAVDFFAYAAGGYGCNVGAGELTGSGREELLTGPGPGAVFGPQVRAFDRAGSSLGKINYFAYGTLRYGANVAGARLDGDVYAEILSGAGPGAVFGPHVRGWNYDAANIGAMARVNFFAYSTLKWGVNVAKGEIDADGFDEILTGPGPGQVFSAQVKGWNTDGGALAMLQKINFLPYARRFGVGVAAGDLDGDGFDELEAAPGAGPTNRDRYLGYDYDGNRVTANSTYAVPAGTGLYGGRLGLGDASGNGVADLATAVGPDPASDSAVTIHALDGFMTAYTTFTPYQASYGANLALGLWGY